MLSDMETLEDRLCEIASRTGQMTDEELEKRLQQIQSNIEKQIDAKFMERAYRQENALEEIRRRLTRNEEITVDLDAKVVRGEPSNESLQYSVRTLKQKDIERDRQEQIVQNRIWKIVIALGVILVKILWDMLEKRGDA